ncbi:MAG: hypothetical protein JOZ02_05055 [Acidobacteria bacterium]|nr:hypothetical protein [Acidobacteriota bacterium]
MEEQNRKDVEKSEAAEPALTDGGVVSRPELADSEALPPKQERALRALLASPTQKEAARAAGISDVTLWRYRQDEAFDRRLQEEQQAAAGHAALRLRLECEEAVAVLGEIMRQQSAPPSARIAAARSIIDNAIRVEELGELRRRVEEMEDFIRAKQGEYLLDDAVKREEGAGR